MSPVHSSGAPRPLSPPRAGVLWLLIFIVMLPPTATTVRAQAVDAPVVATALQVAPVQAVARARTDVGLSEVSLLVGRSTILNVPTAITRVSLTSPEVADALVTTPQQVLIHGKAPGTISMFLWERTGAIRQYEVIVRRDLSQLEAQIAQLFPGEPVGVSSNGTDVVLSGTVSSKYVVEKAADVAAGYVEDAENVVNLLQQQQAVGSNQVLLRVRFAEVSRSALQDLGASFFTNGANSDWLGRSAPPGVPAPDFDSEQGLVFSDFLNLFVFNSKEGIGTVIRALSTRGLFQSLAEPNLIATNGTEASFLAGGEYPYPVAQSSGGGTNVTIQFKEFGIRLNFTPTVLGGDLIHLKVRPEVSALDFSNAVTLEGFRIPALTTRRTETEVELRDGQTFAIAGLMNNTITSSMSKIPGIGDIPILGLLFRSRAHQKNQTELVVMITPQIIRGNSTGAASTLPNLVAPFLEPERQTLPPPPPYDPTESTAPQVVVPAPAGGGDRTPRVDAAVVVPDQTDADVVTEPVLAVPPGSATPAVAVPAPLTKAERKAFEDARKAAEKAEREEAKRLEREAKAREKAEREAAKRAEKEAKEAAKRAEKEAKEVAKRAEKEAKEVAKRAEKEAKEAAKRDEKQREEDEKLARRQQGERRKADEEARERGKALAEAEARLKRAQAAFQAEIRKAEEARQ